MEMQEEFVKFILEIIIASWKLTSHTNRKKKHTNRTRSHM